MEVKAMADNRAVDYRYVKGEIQITGTAQTILSASNDIHK